MNPVQLDISVLHLGVRFHFVKMAHTHLKIGHIVWCVLLATVALTLHPHHKNAPVEPIRLEERPVVKFVRKEHTQMKQGPCIVNNVPVVILALIPLKRLSFVPQEKLLNMVMEFVALAHSVDIV